MNAPATPRVRITHGLEEPAIALPSRDKWPADVQFILGVTAYQGDVLLAFSEPVRWVLMPVPKCMDVARQLVEVGAQIHTSNNPAGMVLPPHVAKGFQG